LINVGCQTVDHIHEKRYIDPDFEWNEWDLKKKAIQLANIMKKNCLKSSIIIPL
jgi:hypothetical protein